MIIEKKLLKSKKSLGQNFLIDKNIIKKIIKLTEINNKNIIEVGPGLGALTDEILNCMPKKLILIEKDIRLFNLLKKKYNRKNIEILNKDILDYNIDSKIKYKIISNLPYNISSKFLLKYLKLNTNISEIICMIQSELANKFDLKYGKMNKYKFLANLCSEYEIKFNVSRNVFLPKPKVESKVVGFKLKKNNLDERRLEFFIRFFFINKRKKIKSNKKFINNIDKKFLNCRYEELSFKELFKIYKRFEFSVS